MTFTINPAKGDLSVIPQKRNYALCFEDVKAAESITVLVGGKKAKHTVSQENGKTTITINDVAVDSCVEISFSGVTARGNRDKREQIIDLVTKYQMGVFLKKMQFGSFIDNIYGKLPETEECFAGPIKDVLAQK